MTEDKMKSDYTMESKYRSEGRLSLPRRRVATKTTHENGDFEMELSLAIKESLKYAKEKEGQLKRVDRTSPLLNGVQSDESFSRMAGKMLSFATSSDQGPQGSEEIQQLKDLLLIHIELIQHQQELLANKDKEIRILRNEKDTLHCRLLKAEKRVTHMKQKEDLLEAQIVNAKEIAAAAEAAAADVSEAGEKNKVTKAEWTPGPGRKRKQKQSVKSKRPTKVKKRAVESDKASESVTSEEQQDSDAEDSDSAEEDEDEAEYSSKEEDEVDSEGEEEEKEDSGGKDGEGGSEEEEVMKGAVDENRDPHPEPVLRTECLYHVSCCVELPLSEPVEVLEEKEVVIGDQVETPTWRINVLTNRYQLEGTENITDEAYQKRHQKHEMEEKRRKRWDIQRLREQRVFDKLRGKEGGENSTTPEEQPTNTFLPNIEDLTHVEISDSVVVMAFGQAVPHVEPSEFELPWDTGPSSSFTRKSHGGRGRQK